MKLEGASVSIGNIIVGNTTANPVPVSTSGVSAKGYYWWDFSVDGPTAPGADILFDFTVPHQDVELMCDQAISIKWGSTTSKTIGLAAGFYIFENQCTNKLYVTATVATNLQVYANG